MYVNVRLLNTLGEIYSYNVWAEIKSVKTDLPKITAAATWVKGHHNDKVEYVDLLLEARENIVMDRKCRRIRVINETNPPIPYFSCKKTQVVVDGFPVTQQILEFLNVTLAGPALCK